MHDKFAILYLHALTAVHPGTGSAIGTVDLPIQRERHTEWPTIAASAIKGVLRDTVRRNIAKQNSTDYEKADRDEIIVNLFGPPSIDSDQNKETNAGAFSVTDARILAFPVRSLSGVFAWVTSPAVLTRFSRDLKMWNLPCNWTIPTIEEGKALVVQGTELLVNRSHIVLEEYDFEAITKEQDIANYLAQHAVSDQHSKELLKKNLVIVHDNQFNYFVRYATEIQARIALNYQTKSVKEGALFYQEFLPTETILYSLVLVTNSRKAQNQGMTGSDLYQKLKEKLNNKVIQIGGDETIGKGYCSIQWQDNG